MKITIDLENHRTPGSKVFTGRDRGKEVKINSRLNELFEMYSEIEILIPIDTYTINPSFLEEYLYDVVKKFGKDLVMKKVIFTPLGEYRIEQNLETAIQRILRKTSSLEK